MGWINYTAAFMGAAVLLIAPPAFGQAQDSEGPAGSHALYENGHCLAGAIPEEDGGGRVYQVAACKDFEVPGVEDKLRTVVHLTFPMSRADSRKDRENCRALTKFWSELVEPIKSLASLQKRRTQIDDDIKDFILRTPNIFNQLKRGHTNAKVIPSDGGPPCK